MKLETLLEKVNMSFEDYKMIINFDIDKFPYINKNNQTEQICLEAVKQNGYAIQFIDKDNQTEKVCIEAVKQNKHTIKYIKFD